MRAIAVTIAAGLAVATRQLSCATPLHLQGNDAMAPGNKDTGPALENVVAKVVEPSVLQVRSAFEELCGTDRATAVSALVRGMNALGYDIKFEPVGNTIPPEILSLALTAFANYLDMALYHSPGLVYDMVRNEVPDQMKLRKEREFNNAYDALLANATNTTTAVLLHRQSFAEDIPVALRTTLPKNTALPELVKKIDAHALNLRPWHQKFREDPISAKMLIGAPSAALGLSAASLAAYKIATRNTAQPKRHRSISSDSDSSDSSESHEVPSPRKAKRG